MEPNPKLAQEREPESSARTKARAHRTMLEFPLQRGSSKSSGRAPRLERSARPKGGRENGKGCTNGSVNSPMVTSHISIKCLHHLCHLKSTDTLYSILPPEAVLEKSGGGRGKGEEKICLDTVEDGREREMVGKESDLDDLRGPLNDIIKKPELEWSFAEMLRVSKRGFSLRSHRRGRGRTGEARVPSA